MGRTEALLLHLLFLGVAFPIRAQTLPTTVPAAGDNLQVFLATMEPGDEIWERFGHDSIVVLDKSSGDSWAYNFGIFDFDAPNFVGNFLRGRMTYWMAAD